MAQGTEGRIKRTDNRSPGLFVDDRVAHIVIGRVLRRVDDYPREVLLWCDAFASRIGLEGLDDGLTECTVSVSIDHPAYPLKAGIRLVTIA